VNILFFGDIMGQAGRAAITKHLPALRAELKPDFIIANAENAAHGYGLTSKIARELHALGIDCLTTGNHVWDQKDLVKEINELPFILRPLNYPAGTPGRGAAVYTTSQGQKVGVANVMGRLFMDALDNPFSALEQALNPLVLGGTVDAMVVDVHAEASSEKQVIAHWLDGRVSAVVGSHTHVPTADERVLKGGTAFQTDAGMCGDYDSVIGMDKKTAIFKMTRKLPTDKLAPATGEGSVCGLLIQTNQAGLATHVQRVQRGGCFT
jgi:2',3'-cyclic-nucleotide 2'-phosphodiesterase